MVVLEEDSSNHDDIREKRDLLRIALVIVGGVGVDTITYDSGMVGKSFAKAQEVAAFRAGGR